MGSEPAEIMQPHAQHAASCSYSTDDLALQLQTASLQRSIAAVSQSPAMAPLAFVLSEHITPYTLPAGAAACGSMPPAALSAAPAEELLLWDRSHASAAAAAVTHAMAASSSTSSPPRAPPTAFYHNPFAIDSPFKMLRQRHLSIEQRGDPAIQLHPQEPEYADEAHAAAGMTQDLTLCASNQGHLPAAKACNTSEPRTETPYKAALLTGGAAAAAAAAASATQPPPAAVKAAAPPALPLRRMPLGDLTNCPQPHKEDPVAKLSTAKPRPGRTSGGKVQPSGPAAAAPAAAAADAPQQQRLVQLGSLASLRTAFHHPPCSVTSAAARAGALAGAGRMQAPLSSMMQQPLLQSSSPLMIPPALLADPTPQHAVPAAAAGGMGALPGSTVPGPFQQHFPHAVYSSSDPVNHMNSAAYAQQAAAVHADSAGISSPGYLNFAGTHFGTQEQLNQHSNNSMTSGHGNDDMAYSVGVPEGTYHAPGGSHWGSGARLDGGSGSGSDAGSWKQIAPEDAPAWCYKLHVASSQGRKHAELGRVDVKTLLQHQLEHGRPIRAPWYRHSPRAVHGASPAHALGRRVPADQLPVPLQGRMEEQRDTKIGTGVFLPDDR